MLPGSDLALVGSINWYDYSWASDEIRHLYPDQENRLEGKRFTRGRHNDGVFVRWPLDDRKFTSRVVAALGRHLDEALARVSRAIVITHHPPFRGLGFPRPKGAVSLDSLLWAAFSGNRSLEEELGKHTERIPAVFCGHTHRAREHNLGPTRGFNIGGDYHFKRLIVFEPGSGSAGAHQFGDPNP